MMHAYPDGNESWYTTADQSIHLYTCLPVSIGYCYYGQINVQKGTYHSEHFSQNLFSDQPRVATLRTSDGIVCPACPQFDLGSKFDRTEQVQVDGESLDLSYAMSTNAQNNGTHPCVSLCDFNDPCASTCGVNDRRCAVLCTMIKDQSKKEGSKSAVSLHVEDVPCCTRKDREPSPTSVVPMLSAAYRTYMKQLNLNVEHSKMVFEFILLSADGIEYEVWSIRFILRLVWSIGCPCSTQTGPSQLPVGDIDHSAHHLCWCAVIPDERVSRRHGICVQAKDWRLPFIFERSAGL